MHDVSTPDWQLVYHTLWSVLSTQSYYYDPYLVKFLKACPHSLLFPAQRSQSDRFSARISSPSSSSSSSLSPAFGLSSARLYGSVYHHSLNFMPTISVILETCTRSPTHPIKPLPLQRLTRWRTLPLSTSQEVKLGSTAALGVALMMLIVIYLSYYHLQLASFQPVIWVSIKAAPASVLQRPSCAKCGNAKQPPECQDDQSASRTVNDSIFTPLPIYFGQGKRIHETRHRFIFKLFMCTLR